MSLSKSNPAVDNLVFKNPSDGTFTIRECDDIPMEEWRQVFQNFRTYPYANQKSRLIDLDIVISKGLGIFRVHKEWDKCIELADWALSQHDFVEDNKNIAQILYYRSLSLIRLGNPVLALTWYIDQSRALMATSHRLVAAFLYGIHVLRALGPDSTESTSPAPQMAVDFARELYSLRYPKKKIPATLHPQDNHKPPPSWSEINHSLTKHLK